MAEEHDGHLGAVYGAKDLQEVALLYDGWAARYEADMSMKGYRHPAIAAALLARYLPKATGPVLDAGAGTGLLGEWLDILGYDEVEALDVSQGMLAVAGSKGCYRKLHHLALGRDLPFKDEHFGAIIAAGVFTSGHVGVEGLAELVRICRAGGVLVLTVKMTLWETGFSELVSALVAEGQVALLERTNPYVSMPGEKGTSPSLGLAMRRC